jgi:hypothetical protein
MKLSFSLNSSFSNFLMVTAAAPIAFGGVPTKALAWAITLSRPVATLAQTAQPFTQTIVQAPVKHHYLFEQLCNRKLQGSDKDIFHLLSKGDVFNKNSDNPPPVARSPGGSR